MERDSGGYPPSNDPFQKGIPSPPQFYQQVSHEAVDTMNTDTPTNNSNISAKFPTQPAPELPTEDSTQGIYRLIKGFTDLGDALHEHITQVCGPDMANPRNSPQATSFQGGAAYPIGHSPLTHKSSSSTIRRRPAHPNLRTPYGSVQEASSTARARRMSGSDTNTPPSGLGVDVRSPRLRPYQGSYIPQAISSLRRARATVFGDHTLAHHHTTADGPRQLLSSLRTMSSLGLERRGVNWENVVSEFKRMAPDTHLTIQEAQSVWNSLPDVRASYYKEQERLKKMEEEQARKRIEEGHMERKKEREREKREQMRRQIEKEQMVWKTEDEEGERGVVGEIELGVKEFYSSDTDDYNLELHCCGSDDSSEGDNSETPLAGPSPNQEGKLGKSDLLEKELTLKAHQSSDAADDTESLPDATESETMPRPRSSRAYTDAQEQWMLRVIPTLLGDEMRSSARWNRVRELFFNEFHELKTTDSLRARWRVLQQRVKG